MTAKKSKKVGYRNPPKEHTWQPGRSGNPSGKSRAQREAEAQPPPVIKTIAEYMAEELSTMVKITENGLTEEIPMAKYVAKRLVRDIFSDQPTRARSSLEFMERNDVAAFQRLNIERAGEMDDIVYTEEDRRLLEIARTELGLDGKDRGWRS